MDTISGILTHLQIYCRKIAQESAQMHELIKQKRAIFNDSNDGMRYLVFEQVQSLFRDMLDTKMSYESL